jgi:flagellin
MSEQMRTQIRGLGKAKQNSQDGQAALQIAEGGLAEITNIMQRQRELAVQAANDTLTSTERKYLDDEFQELSQEIGRIALSTDYNGKNLLSNGSWTAGGAAGLNENNSFGAVDSNGNAKSYTLHVGPNYSTGVGGLHANQAPVTYTSINFNTDNGGKLWGFSIGKYAKDATVAGEDGLEFEAGDTVDFSKLTIIGKGGTSVNGEEGSQQKIYDTIDSLDAAIKSISGTRAKIGTFINRLEYTVNNLANLEYNTQEAESRIRDTDFATETTNYTRNQIMVQSATSMLAQANVLPQSVLGLLG